MLESLALLSLALAFFWLVSLLLRVLRRALYLVVNVALVPFLWWDRSRELLEWLLEASPAVEFLAPHAADEQAWVLDHPRLMRGVAGASVTSGVAGTRLRRRARWVRALQEELGGRFGVVREVLRGRWEPDLPEEHGSDVLRYVAASVENGVKILGGGFVRVGPGDEDETVEHRRLREEKGFYLLVSTEGADDVVFPHLLGFLRQHSLFRQRDTSLLLGLRSRAIDWCRARGFDSWVSDVAVASAVPLALEPSTHEVLASPRVVAAMEASPLLSG